MLIFTAVKSKSKNFESFMLKFEFENRQFSKALKGKKNIMKVLESLVVVRWYTQVYDYIKIFVLCSAFELWWWMFCKNALIFLSPVLAWRLGRIAIQSVRSTNSHMHDISIRIMDQWTRIIILYRLINDRYCEHMMDFFWLITIGIYLSYIIKNLNSPFSEKW